MRVHRRKETVSMRNEAIHLKHDDVIPNLVKKSILCQCHLEAIHGNDRIAEKF
jgi:hypothetical protein